jgi:hypothetical protein
MVLEFEAPPMGETADPIAETDLEELRKAVATLEYSSLAARISAAVGRQVDLAAQIVPGPVLSVVNRATIIALRVALRMAVRSLSTTSQAKASNRTHLAYAAVSGAAGGAFGLLALPVELPISTTIMLRSIADIARSQGEDLSEPEARLACLEVFALGSGRETGPAGESGYLAMRALLAKTVSEAARYMVQRGVADETAPIIVKLIGQIASRFGIVVGQKVMTQAVPLIGAVTGAAINAAFTDHFQSLAQAHFTVRRLERRYGVEPVRAAFDRLRQALRDQEDQPHDKPTALPALIASPRED